MKTPSQEELLDAMQAAMDQVRPAQEEGKGASVLELMAMKDWNVHRVRNWWREGIAKGTVEVVKVKRFAVDGRLSTIRAFRLTDTPAPSRNRREGRDATATRD